MSERAAARGWADTWKAPALVAVAALAVFARTPTFGFAFDDFRFIVENPNVQGPAPWLSFFTDGGTADPRSPGVIVRPLRTTEFALDRLLGGDAFWFHLHSLLWHVAAAVLLLFVLRRLVGDGRAAFAGAVLWAVHPAQVESVAWASSRGDVAMGACVLASVLFWLRASSVGRDFAASLVFALLAALYKETALFLPPLLLVLRWTGFGKAPVWPHFALVLAYWFGYRIQVQHGPTGHGEMLYVLGGSVAGTFATMMRGFGYYLVETFLPAQSLDWHMTPSRGFADAAVLGWLGVHAALVASAVAARRRAPIWTVAVAWFYVFFGAVSNWPYFATIPTAERFLYLPLGGFALALGAAVRRAPRTFAPALAAAVAFGALSFDRSAMWRDDRVLWRAVRADHASARAELRAAEEKDDEALALDASIAAASSPEKERLSERRRALLLEALAGHHRAIDLVHSFEGANATRALVAHEAEFCASNACYLLGDRDAEALFHAEASLAVAQGPLPHAHYDRALPLLRLGFAPQAMESMRRAEKLGLAKEAMSDVAGFYLNAASACERDGLLGEATRGYESAVAAAPESPAGRSAAQHLALLGARARPADADARERDAVAALDAKLARLPRSCPVRRDWEAK